MRHTSPKRGSALLIVLGLLSFLMISAVAFAISMRTERAAASAYRRSLQARELLTAVFSDARATVDYALNEQAYEAGFKVNDDNTHTVSALAPFKYPSGGGEGTTDSYGRLISSYSSDDEIAYLLDDAVMRHIPPYIAYTVYETLEMDECPNGSGDAVTGNGGYNLDRAANWKSISVQVPKVESDDGQSNFTVDSAVVGRMAWSVINLSDALDINAVGSVSQRRGIGLTGSEFAFGELPGASSSTSSTSSSKPEDRYDLLPSTADAQSTELPIFASGADLATYAARVEGGQSLLQREVNGIFPYSWENALQEGGAAAFSPFTVYSFWPNARRRTEDGARRTASSGSSDSNHRVIACNEIDEDSLTPGCEVEDLVKEVLGTSGSEGTTFARLLADYIDTDSIPDVYDGPTSGDQKELYQNAAPTVENVPMVSEVGYASSSWQSFCDELADNVKAAFEGLEPEGENQFDTTSAIPKTLKVKDIDLNIPDPEISLSLRTYFPGRAESGETFTVEPEGFVAVYADVLDGSTARLECCETGVVGAASLGGGSLSVTGGGNEEAIFDSATNVRFTGKNLNLKVNGENLTIGVPVQQQGGEQPTTTEITLTFLVDFVFRVGVSQGSDIVDLCPTGGGRRTVSTKDNYPTTVANRLDQSQMAQSDSQRFRVTLPVTVKFALQWKVETEEVSQGEGGGTKTVYTVQSEFVEGHEPEASYDPATDTAFAGQTIAGCSAGTASCLAFSPSSGTWRTVDPRYNWLSPMMGVSGSSAGYGGVAFLANLSSPHWLFMETNGEVTNGNTEASDLQNAYANYHETQAQTVPFVWGLKANEIRYGYNDAGQLLLPGEVGFLPVPFSETVWTPNELNYLATSLDNYYTTVARSSFFRTIPITDFNDGAFSGTSPYGGYDRAVELTSMFESFGGENFPEEHRGIVNVFAGMDDYYTSQRLRQFAMMGIPSSIRQAAKVTYDRLEKAADVSRVPKALVDSDLDSLKNDSIAGTTLDTEPKYDTFVRDYLFPIPSDSASSDTDSWNQSYTLFPGVEGVPRRPTRLRDAIIQESTEGTNISFAERLKKYNEDHTSSADKLGQNDMTTLVAIGNESFGDRQQLFLYILRADALAYSSGRKLSEHSPLSTARAVALVWRDAYGELPDRLIYWQYLP